MTMSGYASEFVQSKLEKDARKNWDMFYKRNGNRFFKDRHWVTREFQELLAQEASNDRRQVLLEIGCGVGNFLFPLIEEKIPFYIYGCDFSQRAVQLCWDNPLYDSSKCCVFVADATSESFPDALRQSLTNHQDQVDLISLVFVLSSIHPAKMGTVASNLFQVGWSRGSNQELIDHC